MIKRLLFLALFLIPGISRAQLFPWTATFTPTSTFTVNASWTPAGGNQFTPTFTPTPQPSYVAGLDLENTQLKIKADLDTIAKSFPTLTSTITLTPTPTSTLSFTPTNTFPAGTNTLTPTNTFTVTNTITNTLTSTGTPTNTSTPLIVMLGQRSFTSAQSTTPTPIATGVAGLYHNFHLFFNNIGTAADYVTIYNGSNGAVSLYLAPAGGIKTVDIWATATGNAVSIGGGNAAGATIISWGYMNEQPNQYPVLLPASKLNKNPFIRIYDNPVIAMFRPYGRRFEYAPY